MKIREYLRDKVFRKRLEANPCLVIYDHESTYRSIVQELASNSCRVVEVAEQVIVPREEAMQGLQDLAHGRLQQLVVWIASQPPIDDQARQRDLFAVMGLVGTIFPSGDADTFQALCYRAFPTHRLDIDRLFLQNTPTFEMVDALEGGTRFPQLKALLGTTSSKEILLKLMVLTSKIQERLKGQPGWVDEAKALVHEVLGYSVITKIATAPAISKELWRVVLISEFAFDADEPLPSGLSQVATAQRAAKELVFELCNDLRQHKDYRPEYLKNATEVQNDFKLEQVCEGMRGLGKRDTFSFEERVLFAQAVEHVAAGALEKAKLLAKERESSVWRNLNDDASMRWSVLEHVLELLEVAHNLPEATGPSLTELVHAYAMFGCNLDRCHRQLEQIVVRGLVDGDHGLEGLVNQGRKAYRAAVDPVQAELMKRVKAEGWAPANSPMLRNSQLFDKLVKPLVDNNERVAYLLLDSLRFELGVELEKLLQNNHSVQKHTVWAQLPTYTEVGMASLMPEAHSQLKLVAKDGTLVTHLGGQPATTPATRFAYLTSKLGDRCADMDLDVLTGISKPAKIEEKVRLLVVRSYELDCTAHASTSSALSSLPDLLRKVQFGMSRLAEMGFHKVVVATDHGFLLSPEMGPGNLVPKPQGQWLVGKTRCMLGAGKEDATSLLVPVSHVGLTADCQHYAVPRTLAPYAKGETYYHEGLSLQEAVLPCLVITLKGPSGSKGGKIRMEVSYRNGQTTTITTRMPKIELEHKGARDLYQTESMEVMVDAIGPDGAVVGEVTSGTSGTTVNMANKCVRIEPGQKVGFYMRMENDFEGKFTIRVSDPSTHVIHTEQTLTTGYM